MGNRKNRSIIEWINHKKNPFRGIFLCLLAGCILLGGMPHLPYNQAAGQELNAAPDSRSVFLVAKVIDRNILTADGGNYQIKVTYEEDSGIPDNAELAVRELTGQEYEAYYAQLEEAVDQISAARLFDISILAGGEEFHPAAPVTVTISRLGFGEAEEEGTVQAVHFGKNEIEVIETSTISTDGEIVDEVRFEAEGFSVYGIVYTVDFSYDLDGDVYDFSLPGGGKIRLSELIEALGILRGTPFESVEDFLKEVDDVEFSDPALVAVTPITEGDVLGTGAETVEWELESRKAFDTEETLAITMKNGGIVTIRVTDAQVTNLNDLKSNVNYVIYTGSGDNCYVLKPDGTTEKVRASDIPGLDNTYRWRFSISYNDGSINYYNVRPVNNGGAGLALSWSDQPLVQQGNNNIKLIRQNDGYRVEGYNNACLYLNGTTIVGSRNNSSAFKIEGDSSTRYTVRTASASMGKVNGQESFGGVANAGGKNSETITAAPESGFLFDHWELNGQRISNGATIAANSLEISDGSTLTAVFRVNENQQGSDGKPGRVVNKSFLDEWLDDLVKREFPLNQADTTKTAHVVDYENRIYRVDITSKSNVSTFNGDLDLGFILDVSGSMLFPSKLEKVSSLASIELRRLNESGYAASLGLGNGPYFVVADATNTSTVYRIFKQNNQWYYQDASEYVLGTSSGDNAPKVIAYNTVLHTRDTNTNLKPDYPYYQFYTDGDNGRTRQYYLTESLKETVSDLADAKEKLTIGTPDKVNPDIMVAWNTFAGDVNPNHTDQKTFSSVTKGMFNSTNFSTHWFTSTDLALNDAAGFNWNNTNSSNKYAILITDGIPQRNGNHVDKRTVEAAANTLKAQGVTLITVGLSMSDVIGGADLLSDIASADNGSPYFYRAESGDELEYIIREIVRKIMVDAIVVGDVQDEIDPAFYPVDQNGNALNNGAKINLDGTLWDAAKDAGKPYGVINKTGNTYTVKWDNQDMPWEGWKGSVLVKAKEDFLGGNTINTNKNASITPKGYKVSDDSDMISFVKVEPSDEEGADNSKANLTTTVNLDTPHVNVDELRFNEHETEVTVKLGDEVNSMQAVKNLWDTIEVSEVVTATDAEHRNSGTKDPNRNNPETFKLKDVVTLSDADWIKLLNGETVEKPYKDNDAYGHDAGKILITLEQKIAEGETGLTPDGNSLPGKHNTSVEGEEVEKYTLTVQYAPNGADGTKNYHTTQGGEPGDLTNYIESTNVHIVNVLDGILEISKQFTGNYDFPDKDNVTFTVSGPYKNGEVEEPNHTFGPYKYSDFAGGKKRLTKADGITYGTYTVTESGAQTSEEGVTLTQTVAVNGGDAETGASATVTLTAENSSGTVSFVNNYHRDVTSVKVEKSWTDVNGAIKWPEGLTVEMSLYKVPVNAADDGTSSEDELVVRSDNPATLSAAQTSYTWENLSEPGDGYKYVVKEEPVPGYTAYAVQEDGSSKACENKQIPEAPVVDGTASFTNKENDNGKVAIQVTKNILGADASGKNATVINLFGDVTNSFTLKTNELAEPDDVVGAHKGEHNNSDLKDYTSGYSSETSEQPSTFDVTVEKYSEGDEDYESSSTVLISNRTPGMYTITEDKASIPDKIIDKDGKVWKYKETQILTEYAWRTDGDSGKYHYSGTFTKTIGDYTGIPEIAGSYGVDADGNPLYNGRLDFEVNNVYEPTNEEVDVETLNIQFNKGWSGVDGTDAPASGSVTFELHQVATTITKTAGDNEDDSPSDEGRDVSVIVYYGYNFRDAKGGSSFKEGSTVELSTASSESRNFTVYKKTQYDWEQVSTGSLSADNSAYITVPKFANVVDSPKLVIAFDPNDGSQIDVDVKSSGGGSSVVGDPVLDPENGFPKTITLTSADVDNTGKLWQHLESDLLSKTVSVDGNKTTTTTYKYYLVETGRTGLASAYTSLSFNGVGSQSNPITSSTDGATVTVSATNSVPDSSDKLIRLHKEWKNQDGKDINNHPDQVLVDVYRVKLPSGVGTAGGVSFVTEGDIYGVVGSRDTWVDNGNVVKNKVIFEANGQYYYVRSNAQTILSRGDLEEYVRQVQNGQKVRGDWVTSIRPSPVYTPEQLWNDGQGLYIQRGSLCLYKGKYYVFLDTGDSYGGTEKSNGGPGREGGWEEVAAGKVISNLNITPPPNELLISKESIESTYIPELRTKINEQLQKYGMTWSAEDSKLVRYEKDGKTVTIPITDVDKWETSFTAESGYLYFFFEQPVTGFTTLYGNEEHGVFSQTQDVIIRNVTTVGSLEISKKWTVEEGEKVPADIIYAKVYRDDIDITDELAANAAKYGLTLDDNFYPFSGHYYLKVPVNGAAVILQALDIAPFELDAKAYKYVVQERGYHITEDADEDTTAKADSFGIVWNVSDVFENYETKYSVRQKTGEDSEGNAIYGFVEQPPTQTSTGSGSMATPVGEVTTETTTDPVTEQTKSHSVFTAGKGEVTINNASESKGSVKVTKTFSGIEVSQIPSEFKITATWKDDKNVNQTRDLTITGDQASDVTREGSDLTYSWTISDLPKGTIVTFTESGYEVTGYTVTTTPSKNAENKVTTTATAAKEPGTASFVNTYEQAATLDVEIIKVDASTTSKHLTGARFELYRYDAKDAKSYTDKRDEAEVDNNGKLKFEGLTEGYYKLVETKTPDGYVKTTSDPWFHVKREADGTLSVEVVSGSESVLSYSETDKAILVKNTPGVALPSTGGSGTTLFTLLGLLLTAIACGGLVMKRRKGIRG